MSHPRERVQVNVKAMPRKCLTDSKLRLYQHTAIDEVARLRFFAAYPEQPSYSSADFLRKLTKWYQRRGIKVSVFRQTTVLSLPIAFPPASAICIPCLKKAAELGRRHKMIRAY